MSNTVEKRRYSSQFSSLAAVSVRRLALLVFIIPAYAGASQIREF
jgi:hypothetical protein